MKRSLLIFSWGLYDLANQFFAVNVVSLYFVRWLVIERNIPEIFYSIGFGISAFLVAVSVPVLGNISDRLNKRMPFLIYFTLLSIVFTMILGISENVYIALVFFAIANFGCQAAIIFYNALLPDIAPKDKIGLVSGFGRMLGYSGAILALYLVKPIVLKSGYRATFLPTGILFLIFSLPCMIFIKDKGTVPLNKRGLSRFSLTPRLLDFFKAIFFCLCVVNVIILFMSVYLTKAFKLNEAQIINLFAFSTVFAVLGSFISGYICDKIGTGRSFMAIFILWFLSLSIGAFAQNTWLYWFIGAIVGLTLSSTWTVSRVLVIQIAPKDRIGEIFGIFNLIGYISAIIGALFWGLALLFLSPFGGWGYRIALFSLNLFLILGFIPLLRVIKSIPENRAPNVA